MTYPIFLGRIVLVFVGQDVRDMERLVWDLYRHGDNTNFRGWLSGSAKRRSKLPY